MEMLMELPKNMIDMIATQYTDPCTADDDYDELYDANLSDEEILLSFLKEGCDLDGSRLLMPPDRASVSEPVYEYRTLH